MIPDTPLTEAELKRLENYYGETITCIPKLIAEVRRLRADLEAEKTVRETAEWEAHQHSKREAELYAERDAARADLERAAKDFRMIRNEDPNYRACEPPWVNRVREREGK